MRDDYEGKKLLLDGQSKTMENRVPILYLTTKIGSQQNGYVSLNDRLQ